MAVYTQLSQSDITIFLAAYNVGDLSSFKGIAEGVSNTNYLLATNRQSLAATNYILTIFEENFNAVDLPFFMNLTEHLADKGIVCPRPIKNKNGKAIGEIKNKSAVLIEFLQGRGNPHITPHHLELVGDLTARLHLATQDFPERRENSLDILGLQKLFAAICGRMDEIKSGLENEIAGELEFLAHNLPKDLPAGIVHTDIFPDNVFFIDGNADKSELSGIIDFYFSCYDFYIYDLLIVLNAWCFDASYQFVPERAQALLLSYNKIRPITSAEKEAMPILGRLAAMRFLLTRCDAWLNRVDGALVNIKDPMEYWQKLNFYIKNHKIFIKNLPY